MTSIHSATSLLQWLFVGLKSCVKFVILLKGVSSHTPCVFSPWLRVTLCAQVGDEHKEPAVLLTQTELHLSYLLAKTDGVRTKRLTEKK